MKLGIFIRTIFPLNARFVKKYAIIWWEDDYEPRIQESA